MFPTLSRVEVGPVSVALRTNEPTLLDYLAEFYEITDELPTEDVSWTVDAAVGSPIGLPHPNRWGVAHRVDPDSRAVVVRADDAESLAITSRKLIREALVEYCEQRRYTMLHASAFANDHLVMLIVGDKGSGKTTLALRAMLDHGYSYISNDHLILYAEPADEGAQTGLRMTSLPTLLPVKVGTYLDLENRLPAPWDDEGVDLDHFRAMPPAERYTHGDVRLMYTYRGLGQPNPVDIDLEGRRVLVVLASYAKEHRLASPPVTAEDPVTALWPHVRFDWVFDPDLNTQYLPRVQRHHDEYAADARRHLAALAERSRVVSWQHHGDPSPLLAALSRSEAQS